MASEQAKTINYLYIRRWDGSLFDCSTKKWIYGVVKLFPQCVVFNQENCSINRNSEDRSVFTIELPFVIISRIKRSSSSFVFPAITVITSTNEKYWFSSFSNRDETLLFLEHFFHNYIYVVSNELKHLSHGRISKSSDIGKDILRSVVDSNKTLSSAGSQLVNQGDQLRNATVGMMELNNDLNVASRFTKGLASWLPRWRIPKEYVNEDFSVIDKKDVVDVCSVEALYCCDSHHVKGSTLKCIVTSGKEGLLILDSLQKMIQHFKWTDMSRIQVINPWELSISQFHIGKPDRKCNIVSFNLLTVLKEMEQYRPDKIEYVNSDVESSCSTSVLRVDHRNKDKRYSTGEYSSHLSKEGGSLNGAQNQLQRLPDDQEVAEISKELTDLKCLAMDINKEQDKQMKEIDELTSAVTQENDRMSNLNRKINRI